MTLICAPEAAAHEADRPDMVARQNSSTKGDEYLDHAHLEHERRFYAIR
jgi:hypothetical protein